MNIFIDIKDFKEINAQYEISKINLFSFKRKAAKIEIYHKNKIVEVIKISKQKTGFGEREFFICPKCGKRRQQLYYSKGYFICRCCLDKNIYKYRTNLYDEAGIDLINYKMIKLAQKIKIDLKFPFEQWDYIWDRPKYMRHEKFERVLRQLMVLQQLRNNALFYNVKYSASQINQILKDVEDAENIVGLSITNILTMLEINAQSLWDRTLKGYPNIKL